MKRVLILAYDFPPYNSVGAIRPYSWFTNLKSLGIEPVVITRNWKCDLNNLDQYSASSLTKNTKKTQSQHGILIEAPFKATLSNRLLNKFGTNRFKTIRKFLTALQEFKQHLIFQGPKSIIYKEAKLYLQSNKVDAIIATGDPYILFKYASKLSSSHKTKWFADYRDDWIEGHTRSNEYAGIKKLFTQFESSRERKYLRNVSGFITVSNFLVEQIKTRTGIKNGISIENGVDLRFYNNPQNPYTNTDFNILYSGSLYDLPYLKSFSKAFAKLLKSENEDSGISLLFIGTENNHNQATKEIQSLIDEYPNNVRTLPRVSPEMIAKYQFHSELLLNFIAGDPSKGLIGAKSYSYAASRTPILTIPSINSKQSEFFPNRDIQHIAFTEEEIYEYLKYMVSSFKKNGSYTTSITKNELYEISQKNKTNQLVKFINS